MTRFSRSKARWIFYLVVVLAIVAWKFVPRPWKPSRVVETEHYVIASTATQEQTMGHLIDLRKGEGRHDAANNSGTKQIRRVNSINCWHLSEKTEKSLDRYLLL